MVLVNKLSLPVLVLNKNWQAIGTTNLLRAINLLLSENKKKVCARHSHRSAVVNIFFGCGK